MRPSFHPRLINPPFDDPGVFIPFIFEKRAILFDLGEIYSLSARDILKTDHIFISHTHMDHFAGFDRLLRIMLGREKILHIYGPRGFLKNVQAKLGAYSWNLVENYPNCFGLNVIEVHSDHILTQKYLCQNQFIPDSKPQKYPFNGFLLKEPSISVSAEILDHGIPCLGFSLQERFHINILKDRVLEMGLQVGPWINKFKQAIFNGCNLDQEFEIGTLKFTLGELKQKIAMITPGQKITYITDVVYSESNIKKIIRLAKNSDYLFIEAAFLNADKKIAFQKLHLTARQAGTLAGQAGVKLFTIFHFSPRYTNMETQLYKEADKAYKAAINNI